MHHAYREGQEQVVGSMQGAYSIEKVMADSDSLSTDTMFKSEEFPKKSNPYLASKQY